MEVRLTTAQVSRQKRAAKYVRCLLESPAYQNVWGGSDDWINNPIRAARCADAAEYGSDGSTHAEVIQDMRTAFETTWKFDRRKWTDLTLFIAAVDAHIDSIEAWHERNGSLNQVIG